MKVKYSANNSGGHWWLSDEQWKDLEDAGWVVNWTEGRFLGALATSATRECMSEKVAIAEWETITGEDSNEQGCSCCGRPHNFYAVPYVFETNAAHQSAIQSEGSE